MFEDLTGLKDLENLRVGRVQKAPENFLSPSGIKAVFAEAQHGRRHFLRRAFSAAASTTVAATAMSGTSAMGQVQARAQPLMEAGDPHILNLPAHSKGLGQGVATEAYGKPSQFETGVQRRPNPGLT